jgi:GNAT superfamily N-acetyltransferase
MIFATTDLAGRIERAECGLLRDACASATRRLGEGVFVTPLAGGVATFSEPGSPLNKVAGLGFNGPLAEQDLEAVEAAYAARGVSVQVEVSTLADPAIVRQLGARGYRLVGFENVLGLGLPAAPMMVAPDVHVAPSGTAEFDVWLDIVVSGFATPDTGGVPSHEQYDSDVLDRIMRDMSQAGGVVRYLARRGEIPAGGGIMRVDRGVAQFGGASTLPAHRRRGVQTALIAVRLAEAAHRGCDIAVVTTQPGSRSQQNVQRLGFEVLYARALFVRERPAP